MKRDEVERRALLARRMIRPSHAVIEKLSQELAPPADLGPATCGPPTLADGRAA